MLYGYNFILHYTYLSQIGLHLDKVYKCLPSSAHTPMNLIIAMAVVVLVRSAVETKTMTTSILKNLQQILYCYTYFYMYLHSDQI